MKDMIAPAIVETKLDHALGVDGNGCAAGLVSISLVMGAMERLVVRIDLNVLKSQVGH